MKTPLTRVEILSIYKVHGERVLLPERMALAPPDVREAIRGLAGDLRKAGGRLILSDLFRSHDMQLQAHLDWKSGKKKAYSPPPGGSMHEAGRAFDLSLRDLRIPLAEFWEMAERRGVFPIIGAPDRRKSEAWHFDCPGSHRRVADYYQAGRGDNMPPYKAMAVSAILAIGVRVDAFGDNQDAARLQASLIRLGYELGNIDGRIGRRTREAMEQAEIDTREPALAVARAEDLLQQRFAGEYRESSPMEEDLFDFLVPPHVLA